MPPDRVDELRRIQEQVAAGQRVATFETERVRQDGRRVEVSVTVSPLRDAAGARLFWHVHEIVGRPRIAGSRST